ncbi:zinc-binding dehydrogenase [Egicoccus halophilus]|uniref:Zinc-binding alcohol dehydrogenase n=1 Tax=Egicoccus halophilus TaxID=1670830 RepID=A0A8J3AFK2_9ACTN|nr:zinc-binding dehydrogenase [Egicoccus halophilus]GGI08048.1 zinc-binding alcohol dehydrogenase [Egicoccus halophilus]
MRAVVFEGTGGNEVVHVRERPDPIPRGSEVVVAVRHAGINPADLLQRRGHYPAPPGAPDDVPGLEVAGEVVLTGDRARRWRPGDRVFGLVGGGGLAERVVVDESNLAPVPSSLDEAEAAAVPEAFVTAHDALRTQAGLTPGERVLVQGATGGVGTAALQLVTAMGARAYGVSRSEAGRELVASLGATPIADDDVVAGVREHAGAIDVVLELVGAPQVPADLEVLATGGRVVVVGVGAGAKVEVNLLALMGRRARLIGTVLRARDVPEKAAAMRAFEREVVPLLASGAVRPLVDTTYPADAVREAFDHLAAAGKRGKLLLDFG